MAHKNTIPVEIETHGFEDAAEKIELAPEPPPVEMDSDHREAASQR